MSMTDQAYLETYRKLADKYDNNQSSMGEHLEAMKKLELLVVFDYQMTATAERCSNLRLFS